MDLSTWVVLTFLISVLICDVPSWAFPKNTKTTLRALLVKDVYSMVCGRVKLLSQNNDATKQTNISFDD